MNAKLKKVLSVVLVVVLTASVAIGGTLAYLTKDVGNEKNVFSVGDIDVTLDETVEVVGEGGTVKETEDGASYIEVMPGDYLKKEVTVANNGTTPAYVAVTVTLNNALEINNAIDEFYGDENAQEMYDKIFIGWGLNHSKDLDGDGTNDAGMRLTITGDDMPEHVLHVDSVKTIDEYALFYTGNWFGEQEDIIPFNGYYTNDMDAYEMKYVYYIYLEGGESATLFNGLNVPAEFNADQMKMFDGLEISVDAKAIQADNMAVAAQYEEDPNGKAKTAFAILAGDIEVPEDYTNAPSSIDTWNGTADTTWYNDTDTEFTLTSAEQLAGLAELVDGGNTFAGKTVKLGQDINLYYVAEGKEEPTSFNPIGYGYDIVFKGTFDGQGHTISNLYQNGWALGYDYSTEGGGLFASVVDATIKNLTIDNAEIVMECIDMGVVVGYSYGNCTYENITVSNSTIANYQRYTGGVVGEVNGTQTFKNVDVMDTVISSLWGDFDCSLGGIIGGKYGEATITMEDCDVACELNAYNDVTSSYQWYAYRRAGMLIGNSEETTKDGDTTSATASYLTCKNCTVTYDDWANYTYCEFAGTNWPYVRVQAGYSCDAYSNPRYGVATDANGNKAVDDTHVHNDGEDHNILLTFDQLFGGGQGVYGTATHEGVTVVYNNK